MPKVYTGVNTVHTCIHLVSHVQTVERKLTQSKMVSHLYNIDYKEECGHVTKKDVAMETHIQSSRRVEEVSQRRTLEEEERPSLQNSVPGREGEEREREREREREKEIEEEEGVRGARG